MINYSYPFKTDKEWDKFWACFDDVKETEIIKLKSNALISNKFCKGRVYYITGTFARKWRNIKPDNNTYTLSSGNTKVITLNDTSTSTAAGTVTFADGSDISISGNNGTITITNDSPDSGLPAILTDGANPGVTSLYTNTTAAAVRTTIGAGTSSLVLGTTSTTALAGDTTTITTTQASAIAANTLKVTDSGVPAILSDGATPTLNSGITAAEVRTLIGAGTGDGDVTASSTTTFTNKSGSNSQWTNDEGYTTNTGTTTAGNTQTFTNKSGSNSQWTNDEGYTTNAGTVTPSSTDTFTNKSGSNSQWTNDAGYINEAAQTIHTNAIGNAIDFSARVTLDGGVAEGTSGIIKNLQNIL